MSVKTEVWLPGLIFLLILVATTSGIFYHTMDSPITYTTVRGEQVTFQGSGLYRYDPAPYAQEGIIWDVVNLSIGLPLLVVAVYFSQRNSLSLPSSSQVLSWRECFSSISVKEILKGR